MGKQENLLQDSKSDEPEEEEEEEDEEEEALSLSDLPLNEENKSCIEEVGAAATSQMRETNEDQEFNFGSTESAEMCAADEVFFKGQILPLRLSVSSESGLARFQQDSRNPSRCLSRSESMDHGSSAGFTSINSSRSSSTKSYYSSSTNTTTSSGNSTTASSKLKMRNNFHSCPSPNPQIRVSSFRLSNVSSSSRSTQKSTIWDFFRIGLVRAPEIELQDLKLRNNINGGNKSACVSRNSSSGSSASNNSSSSNQQNPNLEKKNQTRKSQQSTRFLDKKIGLFNLSGCKCSIDAVETVPLNSNSRKNNNGNIVVIKSGAVEDSKLKKMKKKKKKKEEEKQEGKQALSRHRTFEWLKELSHGGNYVIVDDDQI